MPEDKLGTRRQKLTRQRPEPQICRGDLMKCEFVIKEVDEVVIRMLVAQGATKTDG
jgi:hypothetical protein